MFDEIQAARLHPIEKEGQKPGTERLLPLRNARIRLIDLSLKPA